ncbi:MAG: diguanylate cyclase [Gammaproteobacteria bacterium]
MASVRSEGVSLIAVAAVTGVVIALLSLPVFYIVWRGFDDVQHDELELEMVRFLEQIEAIGDRNESVVKSWGAWDSLYAYAAEQFRAFEANHLSAVSLERAAIDFYAVIGKQGRVLRAGVRPADGGPVMGVPGFTSSAAAPDFPPIARALAGEVARSRERLGEELFLLAAAPIQGAADHAPSRGAIVIGRRVDAHLIEALGARLRIDVQAVPIVNDAIAGAAALRLVPGEIAVEHAGMWSESKGLIARAVLTDTGVAPVMLVSLRGGSRVLDQARSSMELAGAALLLGLTSLIVIAMWLSQHFALVERGSPFSRAMGGVLDTVVGLSRSDTVEQSTEGQLALLPLQAGGAVLRERIRVLYRNELAAVGFSMFAVLAVSAYLIGKLPFNWLVAWAGVALVVNSAQLAHVRWRRRQKGFPINAVRAGNECAIGATAAGLSIGIGFFLFANHVALVDQATMALVTLGLCSGAAAARATYRPAFLGFALGALLPLVLTYFLRALDQSSLDPFITGLMVGVFGLFTFMVRGYIGDSMSESLKLRFEKDDLLDQISQDKARIAADRDTYRRASLTDGLTGIPNRRSFDETLSKEWNRAQRSTAPLSCLVLDIDFFKLYNDTLGHDQGDECLCKVAGVIDRELGRGGDFAARYGGEEFAGVMPDTDASGARAVAERLRAAIEGMAEPHPESPVNDFITVSIGVATTVPTRETLPLLLVKHADKALYEAKASGRNRVISSKLEIAPVGRGGDGIAAA